jgi:hypothetical protein
MLIVYPMAALIGGLISFALLWPYGAAIALISMPFGGSLLVLLAAVLVRMRASSKAESNDNRAVSLDDSPRSCSPPRAVSKS